MLEMVKKIDVLTPLIVKPEVIPIKYALASDIASALSALGASGGTSVGKSTSGANFGGTGSRQRHDGASAASAAAAARRHRRQQRRLSRPAPAHAPAALAPPPPARAVRSRIICSKSSHNAASAGQFQLFGQTKIIADERTNSLLVFANDDDMKMIKNIINKLDVVLAQVLIDAIIMEINLTGTQNTGVSYLAQRQSAGTFTGAGGLNNLSSAASGFLTGIHRRHQRHRQRVRRQRLHPGQSSRRLQLFRQIWQ